MKIGYMAGTPKIQSHTWTRSPNQQHCFGTVPLRIWTDSPSPDRIVTIDSGWEAFPQLLSILVCWNVQCCFLTSSVYNLWFLRAYLPVATAACSALAASGVLRSSRFLRLRTGNENSRNTQNPDGVCCVLHRKSKKMVSFGVQKHEQTKHVGTP